MRALILVTILVIQCLATNTDQVVKQMRQIKSRTGFAREISDLIELKMMQGSEVEQILEIITDLIEQMKSDQALEDSEFAGRSSSLNADISILEFTVDSLSHQLKSANIQITDVTSEIASLSTTQASLAKQLDVLNGKEEEIRDINQIDTLAFNDRELSNSRLVEALSQIISKLSDAVLNRSNKSIFTEFQRQQLSRKLQEELGVNNPIALLVTVTTKFDVPTVTRIIERLENLRDASVATQVTDNENQVEAEVNFTTLISQIVDVRERLATDLNTNKGLVSRRTNELTIAQRTQAQINDDLPVNQDLLVNTKNQADVIESTYEQRRQQRKEELSIIQQAFVIVSQQSDSTQESS